MPICSRRKLLMLGAAAAGAATMGRFATGAETENDFGGLKIGIQSFTFRDRGLPAVLDVMKRDLHLHYIELYMLHLLPVAPPEVIRRANAALQAADVKALSFGVIEFTDDHEQNRAFFDFARAMGMTNISANPTTDSFDSLDKLVEEFGTTVAIHDHGPDSRWVKVKQIWDALKDHHPKIGLCNDTGHFLQAGEDPLEACKVFKDRMHAVHLKDMKPDAKGNWESVALGDGRLDVNGVVRWLIEHRYPHGVFIEYEGSDPVNVARAYEERVRGAVARGKPE